MSTLTLKQDRKRARAEKFEAQKGDLIRRAFKSVNVEYSGDFKKRLAVLEKYLEGLRALLADIEQNYTPSEYGHSHFNVIEEIRDTVTEIASIRMLEIDPDVEEIAEEQEQDRPDSGYSGFVG